MKLYFKDILIGYIQNISRENSWVYGRFKAADGFERFSEFFGAIVCEDGFDESKFDIELLLDTNWAVDNGGKMLGIDIPAIYDDGEIAFRLR